MGSMGNAICTGFICRLCSKLNRSVIFIFGTKGDELELLHKINSYLPIKINADDELPKTICESCLEKILQHHQMVERIKQVQKHFQRMREEDLASQANLVQPKSELSPEPKPCPSSLSVDPHPVPESNPSSSKKMIPTNNKGQTVTRSLRSKQLRKPKKGSVPSSSNAAPASSPALRKRRNPSRTAKVFRKRLP